MPYYTISFITLLIAKQVNLGNKILYNFILFHDDECFGQRHEEGWMIKLDQDGSFQNYGEIGTSGFGR